MEEVVASKYINSESSSIPPDPFLQLKATPYFANLRGDAAPLPTLDFSYIISQDPDQRSKACRQLLEACEEWGFFFLVNHGISEEKLNTIIRAGREFFELPEDEKNEYMEDIYAMTYGRDDIVYTSTKKYYLWRDSLKLNLHPKQFHLPHKPQLLREMVVEYSGIIKGMTKSLMEAIADALELDKEKMEEMLKMEEGFQMFITNYYPACPKSKETMAMPPHSDLGLFAFLIQNGVPGLQLMKDERWFNAGIPPQENCILVNVADHLEIFSNGRCKSVIHRAATNEKQERISVVMTSGPSVEALVEPAKELVHKDGRARALYAPRTYSEYMATKYVKHPFHCQ